MHLSSYKGTSAEQLKACIDEGFAELKAEHDRLVKQASSELVPIEKIESANPFSPYADNWVKQLETELSSRSSYLSDAQRKPSIETMEKTGNARLAEMKARADAVHAAMLPKLAINAAIYEKVVFLMRQIGIPDSYTTSERTGRSWKSKETKHAAGYLGDLQRNVTRTDGYDNVVSQHKAHVTALNEYLAKRRAEEESIKRAKEEEQKKLTTDRALGVWIGKLGLPLESSWYDIKEAVLAKDKYLRLAVYLALNRGDWNDGPSYAETGLQGFKVETDTDRAIYDDINGHIVDWDGDGRVFRDCEWNYDRISALAKPEVVALYSELKLVLPE